MYISWHGKLELCLFRGPTLVLYQYTIFLTILWLICTYLLVLISGVGNTLFPNILPQIYWLPRWNWLDDWCVSTVPGFLIRVGIHKVTVVGLVHDLIFLLIVVVHASPCLPVRIFIHCGLCPWGCICPKLLVGSWIYVSWCIMICTYDFPDKILYVHAYVYWFYVWYGTVSM